MNLQCTYEYVIVGQAVAKPLEEKKRRKTMIRKH
jgi:hypothetical protein